LAKCEHMFVEAQCINGTWWPLAIGGQVAQGWTKNGHPVTTWDKLDSRYCAYHGPTLAQILDTLSQQGWEVVLAMGHTTSDHTLLLKRSRP